MFSVINFCSLINHVTNENRFYKGHGTSIIHRSGGVSTEAAQGRGKYPPQATDTEVNNCFSVY